MTKLISKSKEVKWVVLMQNNNNPSTQEKHRTEASTYTTWTPSTIGNETSRSQEISTFWSTNETHCVL